MWSRVGQRREQLPGSCDRGFDCDPVGEAVRETGSFEAKSVNGQSRSPLKQYEQWLLDLVRQEPDLTLEEIQGRLLDEHQRKAGISSIWRFFDRHGISFKKKALFGIWILWGAPYPMTPDFTRTKPRPDRNCATRPNTSGRIRGHQTPSGICPVLRKGFPQEGRLRPPIGCGQCTRSLRGRLERQCARLCRFSAYTFVACRP
jgi:hypothetical protein